MSIRDGLAATIDAGIDELIERTRKDGGFSVSMTGQTVPSTGYMVGGYANSLIFGRDVLEPNHNVTAYQLISQYVGKHFRLLTSDTITFLGGWIDEDTDLVYIDISQHFTEKGQALAAAHYHGELAIWDLENEREIRVP